MDVCTVTELRVTGNAIFPGGARTPAWSQAPGGTVILPGLRFADTTTGIWHTDISGVAWGGMSFQGEQRLGMNASLTRLVSPDNNSGYFVEDNNLYIRRSTGQRWSASRWAFC